jgi:hypothetical protein
MADVKIIWDGAVLEDILHGPTGMVATFMITRAEIVKQASVIQCNKRTTKLSRSILKRPFDTPEGFSVIIGAYQPYAVYVHEGTKPHVIKPKKDGGTLHFMMDGHDVYAKSVQHPGYKGNKFLSDNLKLFFA